DEGELKDCGILTAFPKVVDLKAELFRTQETFEKEKLKAGGTAIKAVSTKVFKRPPQNRNVQQRAARDLQTQADNDDEGDDSTHNKLQASWVSLQRKAEEYSKRKREAELGIDDGNDSDHDRPADAEGIMVDFVMKTAAKDFRGREVVERVADLL
ncbi:hypothetical protein HK101_005622, partial [Irineochytrium annulatum]